MGLLEDRNLAEGRLENISENKLVKLGKSLHNRLPERPEERLFREKLPLFTGNFDYSMNKARVGHVGSTCFEPRSVVLTRV